MLATGRELEARASARARRELSALLTRAPTVVHRVEGDQLVTQGIDTVRPGDVLIVAPGEVVPVDGMLASDTAVFDESALTGETALVERVMGDSVRSGGVNGGGAFRLRSTATADESTYAGIVRLVREAQESRAPLVRVADRFALWFVPLTIALAALSGILARDPIRAVAVGGGHALSSHPRRADRAGWGHVASRAPWHRRQGRRGARDARTCGRPSLRQDRHAHRRASARCRHRDRREYQRR